MCLCEKVAPGETKLSFSRILTNVYVTIIGIFLSSGIYIDIKCTCGQNQETNCCVEADYTYSLCVVPWILGLVWILANKLLFETLLEKRRRIKKKSPKKTNQIKRMVTKEFSISEIFCFMTMVIIVISGLIATGFYSFKFLVFFMCYQKYRNH